MTDEELALFLLCVCGEKKLSQHYENATRLNMSVIGYMKAVVTATHEAEENGKTIEEIWGKKPMKNPEFREHLKELANRNHESTTNLKEK